MSFPTEQAWLLAEQHLLGKPSGIKFEKQARDPITGEKDPKQQQTEHSFVIVNDVIYALGVKVGEGGGAVVKRGMTKAGGLVAIKIEDSQLKDEKADAYQAGLKNKLIFGQGLRISPRMKIKFPIAKKIIITSRKLYTVMEWRGESLFSQIEEGDYLTQTQKWMLSLRACLLVEDLKEQGIIHADLKAENLTASIQGNDIQLKVIDLDYSKLLKENQHYIIADKASGSPGYMSAEILLKNRYSYLSDTFALAVMLLFQLDVTCHGVPYRYYNQYLDDAGKKLILTFAPMKWLEAKAKLPIEPALQSILEKMLATHYQKRSDSKDLIKYLCEKLESDPTLEEALKQEVRLIRANMALVSSVQPLTSELLPALIFSSPSPGPTLAEVASSKSVDTITQKQTQISIKRKRSNGHFDP